MAFGNIQRRFLEKMRRRPPPFAKSQQALGYSTLNNSADRPSLKQQLASLSDTSNQDQNNIAVQPKSDIYRRGEGTVYTKPFRTQDNPEYTWTQGEYYKDTVNRGEGNTKIGDESLIRDFKVFSKLLDILLILLTLTGINGGKNSVHF